MSVNMLSLGVLLSVAMLAACAQESEPMVPEQPSSPEAAAPAAPSETTPPASAPWTDRQLVEMPPQEDWASGLLTGGYSIQDVRSGTTYTAPNVGKVLDPLYPTAPDHGHAFLELVSAEGPTIVVDYELKWLPGEGRFQVESKQVQAVDGTPHYTYEKVGAHYKRSE